MDMAKFNDLKQRAEAAAKIVAEIEAVENANPDNTYVRASLKNANTASELLDPTQLAYIIKIGRAAVLKELEQKLNETLGVQTEAPEISRDQSGSA